MAHIDLYFFYDIDVVIPVVEIFANDLPLARVQDTMFRFGRAYPNYWTQDGHGGHCLAHAEWLDADGQVLARSDYEQRDKYLAHVARYPVGALRRPLDPSAPAVDARALR